VVPPPLLSHNEPRLPLIPVIALLITITLYRFFALAASGVGLYVDEAQYWTWAQHLDWGYFSKPPVIAAVIALTTSICGDGVLCVKSGSPLIYPVVALLLYAIARRLFDSRTAFWTALVFITLPGVAFSSLIISTDVPLFLCWTLALYAYLRAIDNSDWGWWLLAGGVAGVGLLTKYTMVIFAMSVVLHLATSADYRHWLRSPKPYAAMLAAALVFAPNVLWNAQHGWPTLRHTTQISGLEAAQPGGLLGHLHGHEWLAFMGGQFAITGPVFLIAWIVQLWHWRQWRNDTRYQLLACFALPFLGLISLQALFGRANANWAAMAYAAATIFIVARMIEQHAWRWLCAGLLINIAAMLLFYHYDSVTHVIGVDLNRKTDFYKRVRGWNEFGAQAQALHDQHPEALFLGDSRDTLAELMYNVRPHPLDAVKWNPSGAIDDHYALTTRMDDKVGRNFIYVTRNPSLPDEVSRRFGSSAALAPIHVAIHSDYAIDYNAWLLTDFHGYGAAAVTP